MRYNSSGTEVLIGLIGLIIAVFCIGVKEYILKKRRKESRCQICGNDLGPELIVLEEHKLLKEYDYFAPRREEALIPKLDDVYTTVERHIFRGEEAKKKIEKPEQPEKKQCPTCGGFDVKYAYIEDGTRGDYCYRCKKSFKAMKDPKYYEKPEPVIVHKIICAYCAESAGFDLPETKEPDKIFL